MLKATMRPGMNLMRSLKVGMKSRTSVPTAWHSFMKKNPDKPPPRTSLILITPGIQDAS
jgi:hypothetical protein